MLTFEGKGMEVLEEVGIAGGESVIYLFILMIIFVEMRDSWLIDCIGFGDGGRIAPKVQVGRWLVDRLDCWV